MNPQRIGCLSPLALISAITTLVILVVARFILGDSMFSPGVLNAQVGTMLGGVSSHSEIDMDCGECHASFWSAQTMTDLCLKCHVNIQAEKEDPSSLHGVLFQGTSPTCQSCHTDHQGPNASLTTWDTEGFSHGVTGFFLTGHQNRSDGTLFACADCHTQGFSTFDQHTCTECHRLLDTDFTVTHSLDFGAECLACHDGVDRYGDFDHNTLIFALTGAHLQVGCSDCHLNTRIITDFQDTPSSCESCHLADDAHGGRFGFQCGVCHSSEGWVPAQFDHSLVDFPLDGQHIQAPCKNCHSDGLQGTPKDCNSCHLLDDIHDGAYGTGCETCHNPSGWIDITFDHSLSTFPLDGAHVNVGCSECHTNAVFKGTSHECTACHTEPDYHRGLFTGLPCSGCHTTLAWIPARYNGPHTFPMDHGGQINTCTDCHQPNLSQWTCYSCHDRNEVDRKHIEEGISNFSDCLRCHPTGQKEETVGGDD